MKMDDETRELLLDVDGFLEPIAGVDGATREASALLVKVRTALGYPAPPHLIERPKDKKKNQP